MTQEKTYTTYTGLNDDWTYRDFQYEVGKTHSIPGITETEVCGSGFHGCVDPFDVWGYCDITTSKFAKCTQSGITKPHEAGGKIASSEITIEAEFNLSAFIGACIEYTRHASSGNHTKHASSGGYTRHVSSGEYIRHASSGNHTKHASSGGYTRHVSSGELTLHVSSGGYTRHVSSGNHTNHASSGGYTQHTSSGNHTKHASSGNHTNHTSSGERTRVASSGNHTKHASSGGYTRHVSSGYCAKHASSGGQTSHDSSGEYGVIAAVGFRSKAKGAVGTWVSLAEYKNNKCVGFATGCIGANGLEPDVWYEAKNGKLTAV